MQDVLGIARGGTESRIYSWYRDGTVTGGAAEDLKAFETCNEFASRRKDLILLVAADKRSNGFYAYDHDGFVTSGDKPNDLINRRDGKARPFVMPGNQARRHEMVGVAWSDNEVLTGTFDGINRIFGY